MQNLSVQNPVPFHVEIYCVDHSPLFYTRAVAVERAVTRTQCRSNVSAAALPSAMCFYGRRFRIGEPASKHPGFRPVLRFTALTTLLSSIRVRSLLSVPYRPWMFACLPGCVRFVCFVCSPLKHRKVLRP
jgi:hypothetical protein